MERSEAFECLRKLFRHVLPRNPHLRRTCDTRFQKKTRLQDAPALVRKIIYMLRNMTLRDIAYVYKKSCFKSLRLLALVADELCRRSVDARGALGAILKESVKARGMSCYYLFYI